MPNDRAEHVEQRDVVILGAGIAGLSAAYALRGQELIVLDARDRVGGRTLSGGDNDAWFNVGAQLITSDRMVQLCRDLGLDLVSVKAAEFGFGVRGSFARGKSPERLLMRMNLSPAEKADFAVASLRLRRKLHAIPNMSTDARLALDRRSLHEVLGRVGPTTHLLVQACCESGAGLPLDQTSALVGLSYALNAFIDPRGKETVYGVRGGTQQVAIALARTLEPDALRLGCRVRSVRSHGGGVTVELTDREGAVRTVEARQCVCALPAGDVLKVVDGLDSTRRGALMRLVPYTTLVSIAWPVKDGVRTPWDGVFVAPIAGSEGLNLFTNYGYLAKQRRPELGGFVNTLRASDRFAGLDDDEARAMQLVDLLKLFPEARDLLDVDNAVLQRWQHGGLPTMRPGYYSDRKLLREPLGNIHFCGDYTSEPGLPGANGSGHYTGVTVGTKLAAERAPDTTPSSRPPGT